MLTENESGQTNQTRRHVGKNSMLTASKFDPRTVSTPASPGLFHHKIQARHSFGEGPGFKPIPTLEYCQPAMIGVSLVRSACFTHCLLKHFLPHSTSFEAISQATMGVKASKLIAIDVLKGICGFGVDIPLTENDCFNESVEIDDEKFDEYLMQEDDDEDQKKKALLALVHMIRTKMKRQREVSLESKRRESRPSKKTRIACPRWYTDPITRVRRKKTPKMSAWWEDYIDDPQPNNSHWAKEFRQKFRLPCASYVMILDTISSDKSKGLFDQWKTHDDSCNVQGKTTRRTRRFPLLNFFS
jgi:hypothetical protein